MCNKQCCLCLSVPLPFLLSALLLGLGSVSNNTSSLILQHLITFLSVFATAPAGWAAHAEQLKMLGLIFSLLCIVMWSPLNWSPEENLWERSLSTDPQLFAGQRAARRFAWSSILERAFKPSVSFRAAAEAVRMWCNIFSFPTRNGLSHLHLFPSSLHLTMRFSSVWISSSLCFQLETPTPITS